MSIAPFLMELHRGAEAAWSLCHEQHPQLTIEVVAEIGSTNTELMERARQGRLDQALLIAAHQTAGRGRMGRRWEDQAGQSLMFSLGLPCATVPPSGLSLVVGTCLASALSPQVRLKWPNDLWWNDQGQWKKLGGILVEMTQVSGQTYIVIGAGINLQPQTVVAGHEKAVATASLQEAGVRASAADLLTRIVPALMDDINQFLDQGFAPFKDRFNALDALHGAAVELPDGRTGSARGVHEDGAFLVEVNGSMEAIYSQEVSIRPC